MSTIEFSMPGSGQQPVRFTSEQLARLADRAPADVGRVTFQVYGLEFCTMLAAVALFQADPRKFDELAAVRCIASGDGLYLAAVNGSSAAAGQVGIVDLEGRGPFSISHEHVKSILAIFKRKLPKGTSPDEYVLEVDVTERELVVADVSKLFGGDSLTMAAGPGVESLERGEQSDDDRVMAAFSSLAGGSTAAHPVDLADGIHFASPEIARIGRAAGVLGVEVSMRMLGRRLVAPLTGSFIAYTAGTLRSEDKEQRPFRDERALLWWRDRLVDLEKGAL